MVWVFRSKAERFFFWLPLIVAFHNNYTSIFNIFQESLFGCKFLNTAIDDHIIISFLPPFHKSQLSVFFILLNFSFMIALQILWLITIYSLLNSFLKWFWNYFCLLIFITIYFTALDHRDVCRRTHVIWSRVKLLIADSWSSCNS